MIESTKRDLTGFPRLCGYQPFQAEDMAELIDEITHVRYQFHDRYWRNITVDGKYRSYIHSSPFYSTQLLFNLSLHTAKDFVRRLLTLDPNKRPTASEALQDKWLAVQSPSDVDLLETVRENFQPGQKLRTAVGVIKAINRFRDVANNKVDE